MNTIKLHIVDKKHWTLIEFTFHIEYQFSLPYAAKRSKNHSLQNINKDILPYKQ